MIEWPTKDPSGVIRMPVAKAALAGLLLSFANAVAAQAVVDPAQVEPRKAALIGELLDVTGALALSDQMLSRMLEAQKSAHPEVDEAVWERLRAKLDVQDLRQALIGIYDRHFSTDDIRAVLAFNKSDAGQRVLEQMPSVMDEAMTAGEQWGRQKALELQLELIGEQGTHPGEE